MYVELDDVCVYICFICFRYCQKFSDKFSSFSPIFERESRLVMEDCPELQLEAGDREFRSTVQLPISCPVRDKITVRADLCLLWHTLYHIMPNVCVKMCVYSYRVDCSFAQKLE